MSSVNKAILLGNIGTDPVAKSLPDGRVLVNINLATSKKYKDKQGNQQEKTEWHKIILVDRGNYKLGDIAQRYLKKGSKVYIEGEIETSKWTDKDNIDRYTTKILANEMKMLSSASTQQPPLKQSIQQPVQQPVQQSVQKQQEESNNQNSQSTLSQSFGLDDDIPF